MPEFGTPKTQPEERTEVRESEVFARLEELNEKELTAKDIKWFESGIIEEKFRSREESSGLVDGENEEMETGDIEESDRTNGLMVLRREVSEKVAKWKENNAE